jgi:glyoxylase-like metal-dependent hydrolase (beta-lactamase superfamily II)
MDGVTPLEELDQAWGGAARGTRGPELRAVKRAAERLRQRLLRGPRCVAVRTLPLTTLAYPTRYAFGAAAFHPAPFVAMTHRCLLVQFLERGALRTLLFNPSDVDAARATPFFARLAAQLGETLIRRIARPSPPLERQLDALGLSAADIDYVAFDHFHTQDLRSLLGTKDGARAPRFPNARLLAPRVEWDDWDDLHPMQRAWFVEEGKAGVREDAIVFTDRDLALGDGVALVRTPGHTSGNQTLFVATDGGIWGTSENGTCVDNWSPLESKVSGLATLARLQDLEVVLNANTPEGGALQYTSMVLERTVVDRVPHAPAFVQMLSSSEVTPSLLAPGLAPTIVHGAIAHGQVARPDRRPRRAAGAQKEAPP